MLNRSAAFATAALVGCGHTNPAGIPEAERFDAPLSAAAPIRLTHDAGIDGFAVYSPDGEFLLYSFQPRDRPDNDRCIGLLPSGGGTRREFCDNSGPGATRTDALEYPTVNGRGDLLYARYASAIGDLIPNTAEVSLRLATLADPVNGRVILQLPTTIEGIGLTRIGTIRWANDETFYFVAEEMTLIRNPFTFTFRDTVTIGRGLLRGRVTAGGVAFEAVSGILDANGFDLSAGRDTIFYTRHRDNRLYAVALGGSTSHVVHVAPESVAQPRELRDPARVGDFVVAVSQDIDQSEPPAFPAGLSPGARLESIRTSDGTSYLIQAASPAVPSFGRIAASPRNCRVVVEFRLRESVSFTTDLYSLCPAQGSSCDCA